MALLFDAGSPGEKGWGIATTKKQSTKKTNQNKPNSRSVKHVCTEKATHATNRLQKTNKKHVIAVFASTETEVFWLAQVEGIASSKASWGGGGVLNVCVTFSRGQVLSHTHVSLVCGVSGKWGRLTPKTKTLNGRTSYTTVRLLFLTQKPLLRTVSQQI